MTNRKKGAPAQAEKQNYSLEELERVLPPGDPVSRAALRRMIVAANTPEELVGLGASYRTEDILSAVPSVLAQMLVQVKRLSVAGVRPPRGYHDNVARLLLEETMTLRDLNIAYEEQLRTTGGLTLNRRAALKTTNGQGIRSRRAVGRALSKLVLSASASVRAELERAVGKATNPIETVASLRAVANILTETRAAATAGEREVMTELGLGEADAAKLRTLADEIVRLADAAGGAIPPQSVDQRALDRQDGMVLTLVRALYHAFRDAYDEGKDVVPPKLGPKLDRLVMRVEGEDADVDEEEEDEGRGGSDADEPRPEGA
jgi:hypothetical protein